MLLWRKTALTGDSMYKFIVTDEALDGDLIYFANPVNTEMWQ